MAKKKSSSKKSIVKKASPRVVASKGKKKQSAKSSRKTSLKDFKSVKAEVVTSVPNDHLNPQLRESEGGDFPELEQNEFDVSDLNTDQSLPIVIDPDAGTSSLAATDPVARYLLEIRKYPLLTREQEQDLARRYKETGDAKAAEQLVTANLRFVVKVASEYSKFGARMIDLIQEGNVGLMHAVREFNPYKGVRLITYAVWWIRGYIREYLMKQYSMVRIGTTAAQKKLFYQLQREKENLEKMGFDQGVALLSGRLGVTEKEVEDMQLRMSHRDVSLDAPMSFDGDTRLMDLQSEADPTLVDDELANREEVENLKALIEDLRPELSERELELLEERILADDPLTLQEIGERHNVSREAIRQMENRLMDKIKSRVLNLNKNQ